MASHVAAPSSGRSGSAAWLLLFFVLLLVAAVWFIASAVPFGFLLAKARSLTASGQISFFNFDFYRGMRLRLRVMGAANLAGALLVFRFRRSVAQFAACIAPGFIRFREDLLSAARSFSITEAVVLLGLIVWSGVLRFHFLFQPMRDDEAYTFMQYSSHPFYAALSFYNAPNNHLFQTLLVRLSYLIFGNHPWSLRLPVFLGGIALVPATYAAARGLCRSEAALLAAGLVASSSMLIEFSTNARGYILVCLAFQLIICLAAYGLRHANWAAWIAFAIVAAIGFYTIPIMLYPFSGVVVWLLASAVLEDTALGFRTVGSGVVVAAALTVLLTLELYSPVFAVSGPAAVLANKWVVPSPFHVFVRELPRSFLSTWRDWNRDLPAWVALTLAVGCVFSLLRLWSFPQLSVERNVCRGSRLPLTFALVAVVAFLLAVQRVVPFERVWLFALPLYFIEAASMVAVVIALLPQQRVRHATVFVAIVLSVFAGIRVLHSGSVLRSNEGARS
jgi:Dolichyl-phosphate-mannose-protein mannosyltransferase